MTRVWEFLKDNGLSLSLSGLFAASLVGESLAGLAAYNRDQIDLGLPTIGYGKYLKTGTFLDAIFVNWQAAVLQLAVLIVLSTILLQRGASHSRKPIFGRHRPKAATRRRSQRRPSWLYRHSLSIAFATLFVISFALHAVCGAAADNEERRLLDQPPINIAAYVSSGKFWYLTFQTWQAEFIAIGAFVVLTVFLREEGSPESKKLGARNSDTGNPNE
jgi:Domain of unknown function (DUF6766)